MAISVVAGSIYINQNTVAVANAQSDFQSKLELQALNAAELANEKKKIVEEVRPTEETHKIDPENEHEKRKNDEKFRQNLKAKDEDKETKADSSELGYRLNIVV